MILKALLLFGALGLASLPNEASAQYINHLQKFYKFDPTLVANKPEKERRHFDTKALTRVNQGNQAKLPKWTFVTTASGQGDSNTAGDLTMVITRLKANLPLSDAFKFDDSNEYKIPQVGGNLQLNLKNIDVMDVVHEEGGGYITCGKVTTKDGQNQGFLLKINDDLQPIQSRLYPQIESLNSCGFWHNKKGFVAVGSTPTDDPKNVGRKAVYLSVKKNLDVKCALDASGTFDVPDEYINDNQFNKVVKYGPKNQKLHAMVGTTKSYFNDNRKCTEDNDVLVMIVNEKCKTNSLRVQQYGGPSNPEQGFDEEGFALTAFKEGASQGLVLTGKAKGTFECQQFVKYDDLLVFRVDNNLGLTWVWRYDIYAGNPDLDTPDFGTAVVVDDLALPLFGSFNDLEKKNILVAGETRTPIFSSQFDSTGQVQDQKDAFVLELRPNGTPLKNEIFGLGLQNAQNGVLRSGLLDMHLTQDGHAVIMGNAKLKANSDTNPLNPKKPYLIERYDTISSDADKKCSVRQDVVLNDISFKIADVKVKQIDVGPVKFKVKPKFRKWKQEVPCKKKDLDIIEDDIFEDDISFDDIVEDDIVEDDISVDDVNDIIDDINDIVFDDVNDIIDDVNDIIDDINDIVFDDVNDIVKDDIVKDDIFEDDINDITLDDVNDIVKDDIVKDDIFEDDISFDDVNDIIKDDIIVIDDILPEDDIIVKDDIIVNDIFVDDVNDVIGIDDFIESNGPK